MFRGVFFVKFVDKASSKLNKLQAFVEHYEIDFFAGSRLIVEHHCVFF